MDIRTVSGGGRAELHVRGRIDAYWSTALADEITRVIEKGDRTILLDLHDISFISSPGIAVLFSSKRKVETIGGRLAIVRMSEPVDRVLELCRIRQLFEPSPSDLSVPVVDPGKVVPHATADIRLFDEGWGDPMVVRGVGDPSALVQVGYGSGDLVQHSLPTNTWALGLGAIGTAGGETAAGLGEFLAVAGAVVHQPTKGPRRADYLLATESLVPEAQIAYALMGRGGYSQRAHFSVHDETIPLALHPFLATLLPVQSTAGVAFVVVAEASGLVGISLRRPPAKTVDRFHLPELSETFQFTAGRTRSRSVALVVGLLTRKPPTQALPFLRTVNEPGVTPQAEETQPLYAHCHGAIFSYKPQPRNQNDLQVAVRLLFERHSLEGVMHLLVDDRPLVGLGDSALLRGTCWFGPVAWEAEKA